MNKKITALAILGTIFGGSVIGGIVGIVADQPEPHVHEFGEWEVTKTPTCEEDGLKEITCDCNEKESQVFLL